jgi:hypothetical protein
MFAADMCAASHLYLRMLGRTRLMLHNDIMQGRGGRGGACHSEFYGQALVQQLLDLAIYHVQLQCSHAYVQPPARSLLSWLASDKPR